MPKVYAHQSELIIVKDYKHSKDSNYSKLSLHAFTYTDEHEAVAKERDNQKFFTASPKPVTMDVRAAFIIVTRLQKYQDNYYYHHVMRGGLVHDYSNQGLARWFKDAVKKNDEGESLKQVSIALTTVVETSAASLKACDPTLTDKTISALKQQCAMLFANLHAIFYFRRGGPVALPQQTAKYYAVAALLTDTTDPDSCKLRDTAQSNLHSLKQARDTYKGNYEFQAVAFHHHLVLQRKNKPRSLAAKNYMLDTTFENDVAKVAELAMNLVDVTGSVTENTAYSVEDLKADFLETLLDGSYMCNPNNKEKVQSFFKLLNTTFYPGQDKITWAQALSAALPQAIAHKANKLAGELKTEDDYDKKTFWRKRDANKLPKAAALESLAVQLIAPQPTTSTPADEKTPVGASADAKESNQLSESATRERQAIKIFSTVKNVTQTRADNILSGTGKGFYTSWNAGSGSRTADLFLASLRATEGLLLFNHQEKSCSVSTQLNSCGLNSALMVKYQQFVNPQPVNAPSLNK